jgi:hypothetical protein
MKLLLKLLLILPVLLNGQNYKDDLHAVLETMGSLKNYSMRIHYRLYLDDKLDKAFQESSTQIKKTETGLFYKQSDGLEFIGNQNYEICLNEKARLITAKHIRGQAKNRTAEILSGVMKNMDALLSMYDKVNVLKTEKNTITYLLHLKKSKAIENIIVCIDREKKMITKVRYTYKEAMEIPELKNTKHATTFEIAYEDVMRINVTDAVLFSEKKYLAFVNGKIKPAKKYAGYTVNVLN